MQKTLVLNAGSSTVKFQLFDNKTEEVLASGVVDRIGTEGSFIEIKYVGQKIKREKNLSNHEEGIKCLLDNLLELEMIKSLDEITKVGHRVVQGGEVFKESTLIGKKELKEIKDLAALAPLHNIPNALGIEMFQKLLPNVKNIAVFDTEFHQTLPKDSYLYALPNEWYEKFKIRRYGMHGTSYKYVTDQYAKIHNKNIEDVNIIICHLGNGASITAIKNGKSYQTSMGLTPLEGLVMGTRSGTIDPAIFEYINKELGYSVEKINNILNKESGMLGLTEISNDFRDIHEAIAEGNEKAKTALDIYVARLIEYIGSYYFRLQGAEALVFTAGVGEKDEIVRKRVVDNLGFLNVFLDEEANDKNEMVISTDNSDIKVMIIPTNEEYQIFKETKRF